MARDAGAAGRQARTRAVAPLQLQLRIPVGARCQVWESAAGQRGYRFWIGEGCWTNSTHGSLGRVPIWDGHGRARTRGSGWAPRAPTRPSPNPSKVGAFRVLTFAAQDCAARELPTSSAMGFLTWPGSAATLPTCTTWTPGRSAPESGPEDCESAVAAGAAEFPATLSRPDHAQGGRPRPARPTTMAEAGACRVPARGRSHHRIEPVRGPR